MIKFFRFFFKKLRLSNPWNYKVPLLISFPYLWIYLGKVDLQEALIFLALSFCTILGIAGFGYLTNDLGDRKKDKLINKENVASELSEGEIAFLLLLFLLMALVPWIYFPKARASYYLLALELMLFVLYALPPFRFKERRWLGVVTDTLYAHVIPAILASLTFYLLQTVEYPGFLSYVLVLGTWQVFLGIRNILLHQLKDNYLDTVSGTSTVVIEAGISKVEKAMRTIILPMEFMTFGCFLIYLGKDMKILLAGYIIFLLIKVLLEGFRYTSDYRTNAYTLLDDFYLGWFPILILISLGVAQSNYFILLLVHILLFDNILLQFSKGLIQRFRAWIFR